MAFEPLQDIEGFVPLAPSASVPEDREAYKAYARQVAQREGIPEDLFQGYFHMESGWNPRAKNPGSSATGIGQIMATNPWARQKGMTVFDRSESDSRWDPYHSIESIAHEVKDKYKNTGDWTKAFTFVGEGTPRYRKKLLASAQLYRDGGTGSVNDGFVPLAPESGFVPLEGDGGQAKAIENFVMEQQPLPVVEMAQKFLEKGEGVGKTSENLRHLTQLVESPEKMLTAFLGPQPIEGPIENAGVTTPPPVTAGVGPQKAYEELPAAQFDQFKKLVDMARAKEVQGYTDPKGAGQPDVGSPVELLAESFGFGVPWGIKAALKQTPRLASSFATGRVAGGLTEAATDSAAAGFGAELATMAGTEAFLRRLSKMGAGTLLAAKGEKFNPADVAKAVELDAKIAAETDIGKASELIKERSGLKVPSKLEVPAAMGSQAGGLTLTDHIERISSAGKDLKRKFFDIGPESKISAQTKTFMFDELEQLSPGIKSDIYHGMKAAERQNFDNFAQVEQASRALEKTLPKESQKRIYAYAVAQQEGGPETLARMKMEVPQLTGPEMEYYNVKRRQFDEYHQRINARKEELKGIELKALEERAAKISDPEKAEAYLKRGTELIEARHKPLPKVENYFTFARDISAVDSIGVSPFSEAAEKFLSPGTPANKFFRERVDSKLPFVMHTEKIYRRYAKAAERWLALSPKMTETKVLAEGINDSAPRAAGALNQWLRNIDGISSPSMLGREGDQKLMRLMNRLTVSALSWNPRTAIIQPTSLLNTFAATDLSSLVKGIGKWMAHGESLRTSRELSNVLKTREFDTNIKHLMDAVGGRKGFFSKLDTGMRWVGKLGLKPLQKFDEIAADISHIAFMDYGTKQGLKGKKLLEYADDMVIKTQASAARSDVANIQTHALGKAMTMFQTFVINDWNFLRREVLGLGKGARPTGKNLTKAMKWVIGATLINSIYEMSGSQSPLPGPATAFVKSQERGEGLGRNVQEAVKEVAAQVPVVGGAFKRVGGSALGPLAGYVQDISDSMGGKGPSVYELLARAAGLPGTLAIKRMLDPKGSWTEVLMGRGERERPKSLNMKGFSLGKPKQETAEPEVLQNLRESFKPKRRY